MSSNPIADLRDQLAGLISQIDTAEHPRPTEIVTGGRNPGARWAVTSRWKVWAITETPSTSPPCVYLTTPQHHVHEAPNDFDALTTTKARCLAMAILAAADWADGLTPDSNVTPLDSRRPRQTEETPR